MHFVVEHDLLTTFASGAVARTGKIRSTATGWHDGYALDMVVQDFDDEDNAILDDSISSVRSKRDVFVSNMPKNPEVKVGFSFVLTGIETVILLLAVYFSVGDMDSHWSNSACETVATRERFMHRGGDVVEVCEKTEEPRRCSRTHRNGQDGSGYVVLKSEQEAHGLSLGHRGEEMILRLVPAPDSQAERNARLTRGNASLDRDLVQSQSELEERRRRLESSRSTTSSSQPSAESGLRILMKDRTATVEQMTEVVCATEAVVAEMRREMAGKRRVGTTFASSRSTDPVCTVCKRGAVFANNCGFDCCSICATSRSVRCTVRSTALVEKSAISRRCADNVRKLTGE